MATSGKPTIYDVARVAGVSYSAVSKVIRDAYGVSPSMRERVQAAIEELHYRPSTTARALRGAGKTLGMEMPGVTNPFFTMIIAGAMSILDDSQFQLIVAPSMRPGSEGSRALQSLVDRHVDGLIAISPLGTRPWLERLASDTPMVMIGRHERTDSYDTVAGDDRAGARLVMDHLLNLGHRRIAHLTREPAITSIESATPHALRLQEYKACMAQAGLGEFEQVIESGASEDEAHRAVAQILQSDMKPTAIFAGNDEMAFGAMRAIAAAGLTTQDVSVVGYDDVAVSGMPGVALTTVDQSGLQMGERAATLLLERLAGRDDAVHVEIEPKLIVRGTTSPPPAR